MYTSGNLWEALKEKLDESDDHAAKFFESVAGILKY